MADSNELPPGLANLQYVSFQYRKYMLDRVDRRCNINCGDFRHVVAGRFAAKGSGG